MEQPFGAAVIIIELTDNDIELQVFVDAFDWSRLRIYDPNERLIFSTTARGRLRSQGGLSELAFASEPSHYLNDEDEYDEEVEDFLKRWPEGHYQFEGNRLGGLGALDREAYLSHVLAALPEVTAPEEDAVVPFDEPLLIAWDPVTEQYTGEDGTLPTFGDPDADLRMAAVYEFADAESEAAPRLLQQSLSDVDPAVRNTAAELLND